MDTVPRQARAVGAPLTRAGLAAALLVLGLAGNASAHVFPDHSDPRVGSTVGTPPPLVRIWFDGAMEPVFSTIRVVEADSGRQVDSGNGRVDPDNPTLLEAGVPALPPGKYRVVWSVVARDGHRTEGDFVFRVKGG